ncbi:hypothetical protein [Pedobacter aquae]|uniref:hypothetical protein n=1 Tax=Pedobacter aquae TaxID=2605747 RepID=UPI00143D9E77|nr:hypothetical protein [Pedobacter aquae]
MNDQPSKAHTLPSRTSRHTSQNLAKSVLLPTQEEIQFFFSLPSEIIKTPDTQTNPTKTMKLNNDNGLLTQWTRTPAGNRRLAQWRVTWLIEHSTSHQHLWCIDSFVLRNPPLRQAPNR